MNSDLSSDPAQTRSPNLNLYKDELGGWLSTFEWDWFVTLTFPHRVHPEQAAKRFKQFIDLLDDGPVKIRYARTLEHQQRGAIHIHAVIFGVGHVPRRESEKIWRGLTRGLAQIREYDPTKKGCFYLVKQLHRDDAEFDVGGTWPSPDDRRQAHVHRADPSTQQADQAQPHPDDHGRKGQDHQEQNVQPEPKPKASPSPLKRRTSNRRLPHPQIAPVSLPAPSTTIQRPLHDAGKGSWAAGRRGKGGSKTFAVDTAPITESTTTPTFSSIPNITKTLVPKDRETGFETVIKGFGVLKQTPHWATNVRVVERGGERYVDIRKAIKGHFTKQGISITAPMFMRLLASARDLLDALHSHDVNEGGETMT